MGELEEGLAEQVRGCDDVAPRVANREAARVHHKPAGIRYTDSCPFCSLLLRDIHRITVDGSLSPEKARDVLWRRPFASAHLLREQGVGSSNLPAPTNKSRLFLT